MYVPAAFAETDPVRLQDHLRQHSFGLLVSQLDGLPFATHLPLRFEPGEPHGWLIGHLARANPQWCQAGGQTVLAVFSGPHAYVSPTWYAAENMVPTWNYTAVHVYGRLQLIEDPAALRDLLRGMVQEYEQAQPQPWALDETARHVERLLAQIVGFRIAIERIEGKWKLGQNHPPERRRRALEALRRQGGEQALAVADGMEATLATAGAPLPSPPPSP